MKVIPESEMNFGKYDEKNLFHIEKSEIYKKLGDGIPTVEFILKYNGNNIVFLEAKKSCPNVANRYESKEKEQKFEEYYDSITEKFIASLQISLPCVSTPADIFLVFRTLLNCLKCIILEDCYNKRKYLLDNKKMESN